MKKNQFSIVDQTYKINKKEFQAWLTALRSGRFQQGKDQLQSIEGYCCLGVACAVTIPESKISKTVDGRISGTSAFSQSSSPRWLKEISDDVKVHIGHSLEELNDAEEASFDEIADILQLIYVEGAFLNE